MIILRKLFNFEKKVKVPSREFDKIIIKINELEQKLENNIDILKDDPKKNIIKLLKHMQKVVSVVVPATPCGSRCSMCCYIDVSVSDLEIQLIDDFLLKNKIKTITRKTENIISIYDKEKTGYIFGYMCGGVKCPFLAEKGCIIYKVRPYYCREHMALGGSNENCKNIDVSIRPLYQFLKREIYFNIIKQNKNLIHTNQISFEIRDCFCEG